MRKVIFMKSLAVLTAFIFTTNCHAQTDSINQRIFLIGDAGELSGDAQPVIDWIRNHADMDDEKTVVIYLGDNIYPLGMPLEHTSTYDEAKKIIDYEAGLVKGKKAKAFFVPGNHDWENGKLGGLQRVINQETYIRGLDSNMISMLNNGCPGPEYVELSDKVVVAFLDSEWWLYVHTKPGATSSCNARTKDEIIAELQEIADSHPNQLLVVAMHHPLYSYGPHGGNYTWKSYIFPFTDYIKWLYIPMPGIGFIYPIARGVFGNIQDVKHPVYRDMIRQVESVLKKHTNTIHVAGHDHGLQFLLKDSIPYVVSGSGSNLSRLKEGKYTVFNDREFGFALLQVYNSGKTTINYYNVNSAGLEAPIFSQQLDSIKTVDAKPPVNIFEGVPDSLINMPDTLMVIANPQLEGNGFKNLFLGKNYRAEWTTPIKVPVLNFGTELGGLTPLKKGGGKQTKSLKVKDASGKEWSIRSVEKFPENAIPADLRQTLAQDLVEDGISASYPFGALSITPMANAAGVPALKGKLVYVPDDPRLQRFRSDFKNMLAIMEEKIPDTVNNEKTHETDEIAINMAKDNDNRIDQKEVLRARLLDNFIMDFDRHEGQWNWVTYDTGKGKVYYAIPKDRDQAFFTNQGILPHFIDKPWLVPELQGFKAKADNIRTFNRPARNFDRAFLTELGEQDWQRAIDTFLMRMTDSVIVSSLMQQPYEVQNYSVPSIINTLKEKRKYFRSDMMKYYRFISKTVSITASNKQEQFTITKNADGSVRVVVNKINKSGVVTSKMYERLFDPKVTRELRLYGLEGDDRFVIQGGRSPIKIRIIGGPGNDTFDNEGHGGTTIVYDANFEENKFTGNDGLVKHISDDPQINRYDRLGYKYEFIHPGATIEYNVDDGVFLGAHLELMLQGFRKDPYSAHHVIKASRALRTSSYHFSYNAEFKELVGKNDLIIKSDIKAPINVTNFFGIGNNTVKEDGHSDGIRYYRARYNIADVSVLLHRQLQSWMMLNYGTAFQYFKLDRNENAGKYVSNTNFNGLDPATLYNTKTFLGAQVGLDINNLNYPAIPTRGVLLNTYVRSMLGLSNSSNAITQLQFDLRFFASKTYLPKWVFAVRFGAGHNIGNYAFPQAQYLSGTDNLRGYRRDRFAGRSMFYNNFEIRYKVNDFVTYLFPGSWGLEAFNDVGRVWAAGDHSKNWHDGYGIGVWVAPLKRFVVTASVARSEEEKALPLLKFGFQF